MNQNKISFFNDSEGPGLDQEEIAYFFTQQTVHLLVQFKFLREWQEGKIFRTSILYNTKFSRALYFANLRVEQFAST